MRSLVHIFDSRLIHTILSLPAWIKPFFSTITALGDPIVIVLIGVTVIGYGQLQHNIRFALAGATIWLTLATGSILKLLFSRERPVTEYAANLQVSTFSFPSGHASGSTIAYGLLAYIIWHTLPQPWNYIAAVCLVLLIILIGVSRVYLGAHFPSDVIAGWILGVIALCIVIFIVRPLS